MKTPVASKWGDRHGNQTGSTRPTVYVLWEGVPIDELGIFDSLLSVSFTVTVGRTKPSKKFVSGKPKVGGASLEFSLQDRDTAAVIARLLHVKARPTISLAFGFGDTAMWVGGFQVGSGVNKEYKKIGAFKMDKITWDYPSSSMPKVTLAGLTEKAMSLVEKMKPRVYTETTMKKIFEGVTDEHGITLDIDPALPADQRVKNIIKTSHESDWHFLSRMAEQVGAAGIYLEEESTGGLGSVGASSVATQFKASGGDIDQRQITNTVRSILRISKIPAVLNLNEMEQYRPYVIGYGAFLSTEQKAACDQLATKVTIEEEGYKTGGEPTTASTKKDGSTTIGGTVASAASTSTGGDLVRFAYGKSLSEQLAGSKQATSHPKKKRQQGEIPGTDTYNLVISSLPDEVDEGRLSSAKMQAVALNNGFTFTVNIELFPGNPGIQAPNKISLVGTDSHDGLYGIEESTIKWDASKGLTTTLKCKAIVTKDDSKKNPDGGKGGGAGGTVASASSTDPNGALVAFEYDKSFAEMLTEHRVQPKRQVRSKPEPVAAK